MKELSFEAVRKYYRRVFDSLSEDEQVKLYKLITSKRAIYGYHSIMNAPFKPEIAREEEIERHKEKHLRESVAHGIDIIEAKGDRFELVEIEPGKVLNHPHLAVFLPHNMVDNFHDFAEILESIAPEAITIEGDTHDLDNKIYALIPKAIDQPIKMPKPVNTEDLDIVPIDEL